MIKHYCDICKEDITNNLFINELEFNFLNGCCKESKLEICADCANQILNFVDNLEQSSKKDNSKMKKVNKNKVKDVINNYINEYEKEKSYRYTGDVNDEQEILRQIINDIMKL